MFRNIGKRIRFLAILVAILTLVAFLALAVVFLVAAIRAEDATTRAAGIEGAILFFVLGAILPLFSFVLYGFGILVESGERQAADTKEMRDMLKKALAEGALSDEIARKTGVALAKITAAPAPRAGVAPSRPVVAPHHGPAVRREPAAPVFAAPAAPGPAIEPVAPAAPAAGPGVPEPAAVPEPAPEKTSPALKAEEPAAPLFDAPPEKEPSQKADGTPFAPPTPVSPAAAEPFVPDDPSGAIKPIRPLHSDTTY